MKRIFDFVVSFFALIILSPLFLIVAILIKIDSNGSIFYKQVRVGKNNKDFLIYKFRTMCNDADKKGLLTVGSRDTRVTKIGYYLRKTKIDELSQLINVLEGTMSFVGPRPEVRKYVDLYTVEQQKVLEAKPGITDLASIEFIDENALLAQYEDPNKAYIEIVLPQKIALNLKYLEDQSFFNDIKLIFKTIFKVFEN